MDSAHRLTKLFFEFIFISVFLILMFLFLYLKLSHIGWIMTVWGRVPSKRFRGVASRNDLPALSYHTELSRLWATGNAGLLYFVNTKHGHYGKLVTTMWWQLLCKIWRQFQVSIDNGNVFEITALSIMKLSAIAAQECIWTTLGNRTSQFVPSNEE